MQKNDILKSYEKVELMITSVSELVVAQHFEAAALMAKRLEAVSAGFKEEIAAIPDNEPETQPEPEPEVQETQAPSEPA